LSLSFTHSSFLSENYEKKFEVEFLGLIMAAKERLTNEEW
jgi:hypothetical protein